MDSAFNSSGLEVPKNNFLIVENDPNDAFLIKRALQLIPHCGASFVCRNASEAKAYLRGAGMYADREKFPFPRVVLSDLRMGEETGIELVAWIRKQPSPTGELTAIILTGSATSKQYEEAERVGAQKVYRKPTLVVDLEKLLVNIAQEFCSRE